MSLQRIRLALRRELADLAPNDLVLIGCSGGPDSLALAAGAASMAGGARGAGGIRFGAVVVDHQLQAESGATAAWAATACVDLGLDPVDVIPVVVGDPRLGGGPEAAARSARRAALVETGERHDAKAILLAHTLDDQAETVLLRLARGSGARSLAAMAPRNGLWRRPLLSLRRAELAVACAEAGLTPHFDPHNNDAAFTRVRVRRSVLPALERELGPGVVAALARSADLLRADADALDAMVTTWWTAHGFCAGAGADQVIGTAASTAVRIATFRLSVSELLQLPPALRTRVLRRASIIAGSAAGALTHHHVQRIDQLLTNWHGQGPVALPGGIEASRSAGSLRWIPRTSSISVSAAR